MTSGKEIERSWKSCGDYSDETLHGIYIPPGHSASFTNCRVEWVTVAPGGLLVLNGENSIGKLYQQDGGQVTCNGRTTICHTVWMATDTPPAEIVFAGTWDCNKNYVVAFRNGRYEFMEMQQC